MDRLYEIWDAMVTWMTEHGEEPLFNLAQGIILGAVLVADIWIMVSICKSSKQIKRLEAELEAEDEQR